MLRKTSSQLSPYGCVEKLCSTYNENLTWKVDGLAYFFASFTREKDCKIFSFKFQFKK